MPTILLIQNKYEYQSLKEAVSIMRDKTSRLKEKLQKKLQTAKGKTKKTLESEVEILTKVVDAYDALHKKLNKYE